MSTDPNFYHALAQRGLARSQRDYSRYYLGMAENYACLRGDRPPSERALINLFRRLWSERHFILAIRVATALLWGVQSDG
jgi:hypothetical protein